MEEAVIKRVMPHSIEAEQSVIGSMLMDREAVMTASEILTSDMLWSKRPGTGIPSHRMPELIGKTAVRNIEENTLLSWEDVR